ncbi:hypothetical protein [Pseudomonas jessenii]|uniref:hypothetical protein n=1 Tax=Pseudomonas jessenii TaxID=77298 RepID=UPI001F4EA957|nr:hypothetical protein [Pseudomonas jessenii]
MSSLCIEHVVLLQSTGASWAARPRWKTATTWRSHQDGEPLGACAALLERAPRGRLRYLDRVTLLLGFPHVHYWMLPWQAGLYSQADWQGYARASLSQQTGIDPTLWQVQVAPPGFGQSCLAVATPLDLLEDLRILFKLKALPFSACVPLLTATLQHYGKQLRGDCVLAVPETSALGCVYLQQGKVSQVCLIHTAPDSLLSNNLFTANLLVEQHPPTTFVATPRPVEPPEHWLGPPHPWLMEPAP